MIRPVVVGALLLLLAAAAAPARAQDTSAAPRPPARGETATPQLLTVRPREPLRFDAQLVVPAYYDRNFWPAIRAGVDVVAPQAARAATAPPPARATAAPRAGSAAVRPPR